MRYVAWLMKAADYEDDCEYDDPRKSVGLARFEPECGLIGGKVQTFKWRQTAGSFDADHIISTTGGFPPDLHRVLL